MVFSDRMARKRAVREEVLAVFFLETDGYYLAGTYSGEDTIRSLIVPHFPVQVKQFFIE
ncbi:MAG TPA: hypothetical protein VFB60_24280 [Ktedonobacteraceae bacterium]|nr:hypothetical protein [Ktedonobacteraceae bacterium]